MKSWNVKLKKECLQKIFKNNWYIEWNKTDLRKSLFIHVKLWYLRTQWNSSFAIWNMQFTLFTVLFIAYSLSRFGETHVCRSRRVARFPVIHDDSVQLLTEDEPRITNILDRVIYFLKNSVFFFFVHLYCIYIKNTNEIIFSSNLEIKYPNVICLNF